MIANISSRGINVLDGFVLTVDAYDRYREQNGLANHVQSLIDGLDVDDLAQLRKTGMEIRQFILDGGFFDEVSEHIKGRYTALS